LLALPLSFPFFFYFTPFFIPFVLSLLPLSGDCKYLMIVLTEGYPISPTPLPLSLPPFSLPPFPSPLPPLYLFSLPTKSDRRFAVSDLCDKEWGPQPPDSTSPLFFPPLFLFFPPSLFPSLLPPLSSETGCASYEITLSQIDEPWPPLLSSPLPFLPVCLTGIKQKRV